MTPSSLSSSKYLVSMTHHACDVHSANLLVIPGLWTKSYSHVGVIDTHATSWLLKPLEEIASLHEIK